MSAGSGHYMHSSNVNHKSLSHQSSNRDTLALKLHREQLAGDPTAQENDGYLPSYPVRSSTEGAFGSCDDDWITDDEDDDDVQDMENDKDKANNKQSPIEESVTFQPADDLGSEPPQDYDRFEEFIPNLARLNDSTLAHYDRKYKLKNSLRIADIPTHRLPTMLMYQNVPRRVVLRLMEDRLWYRVSELSGGFDQLRALMKSSWAPEWNDLRSKHKDFARVLKMEIEEYLYLYDGVKPTSFEDEEEEELRLEMLRLDEEYLKAGGKLLVEKEKDV
ncbi:hypothetical protein BJ508DRAFT_329466 [Ascobolus immersus RN42]|uniref:Uncharacterized protein n=1 Tax=Ascobolus immersus RN42 TaxID=1160509 RepID=A0A3N4I0G3_ASCIM|nr:hypothetical protein BJ508DRAFT_329466 [Ascobolus immersus RN42]